MMTSTDPIADMLTRIRNAIRVHKSEVNVPHSKVKESIAKLLQANHFVDAVEVNTEEKAKTIHITISKDDAPIRITEIDRISKPGRRLYTGVSEIPTVKRGRGIVIISTSKGMMTGAEARANKLGGELICKVY